MSDSGDSSVEKEKGGRRVAYDLDHGRRKQNVLKFEDDHDHLHKGRQGWRELPFVWVVS